MPEPDHELDLKRLERCAGLIAEVATERERFRALLNRAQLILDRTTSKPPAGRRLTWEWYRK